MVVVAYTHMVHPLAYQHSLTRFAASWQLAMAWSGCVPPAQQEQCIMLSIESESVVLVLY
jgi:hypothetical protein